MKLLAITDLHGAEEVLEKILAEAASAKCVLFGGDITDFGEPADAERLVDRACAGGRAVWAVAGNCDSPAIDRRLQQLGVSLHGHGVVHQGLGLHGVSAIPPWHRGMYQFSEMELAMLLEAGYAETAGRQQHVVLTHAPPRGTVDRTSYSWQVGSTALKEFIIRRRPALVLCGHVHEARGTGQIGATQVVNCGAARAGYYALADVGAAGDVRVEICRAPLRRLPLDSRAGRG